MELNTLTGARSIRLLAGHGVRDCAASAVESGLIVETAGCGEMALGAAAVAGVLVPCAFLLYLFAREWQRDTPYRASRRWAMC